MWRAFWNLATLVVGSSRHKNGEMIRLLEWFQFREIFPQCQLKLHRDAFENGVPCKSSFAASKALLKILVQRETMKIAYATKDSLYLAGFVRVRHRVTNARHGLGRSKNKWTSQSRRRYNLWKVTDGLTVIFFPIQISLQTAFKGLDQKNSFSVNYFGHYPRANQRDIGIHGGTRFLREYSVLTCWLRSVVRVVCRHRMTGCHTKHRIGRLSLN